MPINTIYINQRLGLMNKSFIEPNRVAKKYPWFLISSI